MAENRLEEWVFVVNTSELRFDVRRSVFIETNV